MVEAAETLGLEPIETEFYGEWDTADGHPCFLGCEEIEEVGRKYFAIEIDGRKEKVKPAEYEFETVSEPGELIIRFDEKNWREFE